VDQLAAGNRSSTGSEEVIDNKDARSAGNGIGMRF
jgi:hypothetical protein